MVRLDAWMDGLSLRTLGVWGCAAGLQLRTLAVCTTAPTIGDLGDGDALVPLFLLDLADANPAGDQLAEIAGAVPPWADLVD
mmetsp:Transcript_9283/g.21443  ORF Transcript_9283/g.21443 Transcript_9283/m.21443 type:complete len:82 (+) Transcript_9283:357-602(+)